VRVRQPQGFELEYRQSARLLWDLKLETGLRLGIVPVVHRAEELQWFVAEGHYRVQIAPHLHAEIGERLTRALDWVAEREVDLILMPELVGSKELLRLVRHWRAKRKSSKPRLLLAASYLWEDPATAGATAAPRVRNHAVVLDGAGLEVWHQNKMHAYDFKV